MELQSELHTLEKNGDPSNWFFIELALTALFYMTSIWACTNLWKPASYAYTLRNKKIYIKFLSGWRCFNVHFDETTTSEVSKQMVITQQSCLPLHFLNLEICYKKTNFRHFVCRWNFRTKKQTNKRIVMLSEVIAYTHFCDNYGTSASHPGGRKTRCNIWRLRSILKGWQLQLSQVR